MELGKLRLGIMLLIFEELLTDLVVVEAVLSLLPPLEILIHSPLSNNQCARISKATN